MQPRYVALWFAAVSAVVIPASALAQGAAVPDESRITVVRLYPGSATVERVARATAGSKKLTFNCLPAQTDPQSLQVMADASVQLGEVSFVVMEREASGRCNASALDARILELEDRKAVLEAENESLGFVTGYLRGFSAPEGTAAGAGGAPRAATPAAGQIASTADALRRTGQESLLRQHQLRRQQEALDLQLKPLLAERERVQAGSKRVGIASVTLDATRDAEVRLSYTVNGPGWAPSYRAHLDTASGALRVERQAQVAQATGEDWRGVQLRLSTAQPRRTTSALPPLPWRIGVRPTEQEKARSSAPMMAAAPAPAPAGRSFSENAGPPLFDTSTFNGAFATEFVLPQRVDVPSSGERVAVMLGNVERRAQLVVRSTPQRSPDAFLLAEFDRPEGVWLAGPVQLYRDGALAGTGAWPASDQQPRVSLSFGRDEQVGVRVAPPEDVRGTGGFTGSRVDRRVRRVYTVENRHTFPVTLEILEAGPVSTDERVKIETTFVPVPEVTEWQQQPGVVMWRSNLAARDTRVFEARYVVSHPSDVQITWP